MAGCVLAVTAIIGCEKTDSLQPPMTVPKFEAVYVDSINQDRARLNAVVSNQEMLTSLGFVIQSDNSTIESTLYADLSNHTIWAWADNLEPQTKYRFWAKADNGGGITLFSDTVSFETLSVPVDTTNILLFENENLRKWLTLRYDSNKDGNIDTTEAKNITIIDLRTDSIPSIKGIERLHSLTKITAHGTRIGDSVCGKLEHIDLSGSPDLRELHVEHNKLKDIDFSNNTKLTFVELNMNEITQIDVSMLKEVDLLSVEHNLITRIDCSGLDRLTELHIGHCPNLTSITLDNKVLESLDCAGNSMMTEIDLSKCPMLNVADFWGCNNLTRIIMSHDQTIGTLTIEPDINIEFIYE